MPESLSIRPESSDRAEAAIAVDSPPKSQRVRELPPPPRAGELPGPPPSIETDESQPARWRRWWPRWMSSGCTVSFLLHFSLLLVLALIVETLSGAPSGSLIAYFGEPLPLDSALGESSSATVEIEGAESLFRPGGQKS